MAQVSWENVCQDRQDLNRGSNQDSVKHPHGAGIQPRCEREHNEVQQAESNHGPHRCFGAVFKHQQVLEWRYQQHQPGVNAQQEEILFQRMGWLPDFQHPLGGPEEQDDEQRCQSEQSPGLSD